MNKYINKRLLTLIICTVVCTNAFAANRKAGVSTGFYYSTGKYGGTENTDMWYFPFTTTYKQGKWRLKLTIPYLEITGPGNVVRDIGQLNTSTSARATISGMGDIVADTTYSIYSSKQSSVFIDLTGKVKFGTADENKNLGTGKNDYAVQSSAYKLIDNSTLFGTLGYKVYGDPTGRNLNNVFYGSIGGQQKLSAIINAGVMVNLKEKTTDTNEAQKSLTIFSSSRLDNHWKIQGYLIRGFSDSTPDWSGGATLGYGF